MGDKHIFCAGIDNSIKAIDLTTNKLDFTLEGHSDTPTCLSLSHCGSFLLSNSLDNTLRSWDIRPFAPSNRVVGTFLGHQHSNLEKNLLGCAWSQDDKMVAAGSADRLTWVWNALTAEVEHTLGGHKAQVNDVKMVGERIVSASSDKTIIVGNI